MVSAENSLLPQPPDIENQLKLSKPEKRFINILDNTLSCVLTGPLVVGNWRGTWNLMDLYKNYFPLWETFFLSTLSIVVFALIQNLLFEIFVERREEVGAVKTYIFSKIYVYIFSILSVMHWRAVWDLYDKKFGLTLVNDRVLVDPSGCVLPLTIFSVFILVVFKCVVNATSNPMVVCWDHKRDAYYISTRYKTNIEENVYLYILDCLFSVIIVGTLVVFVWRGAWVLIDMHIYPEDPKKSAWASLVLGYIIVIIVFCLQSFMRWTCDKLTGVCRILAADLFMLIALFGTINVWRGIWNLLDLYFLPDNPELSCWITHWVCLIILILLRCSNSLLVRGVYIDGEEPGGKCVVFPCYYLRVIFQNIRKNQLKNNLNLTEMALKTTSNVEKITPIENNHIINTNTIILQNHTEEKC